MISIGEPFGLTLALLLFLAFADGLPTVARIAGERPRAAKSAGLGIDTSRVLSLSLKDQA